MTAGSSSARPTVFGVLMTRNEDDLLRFNLMHHLRSSCDRIIVVENGSTDKTRRILKRLAKKYPIDWTTQAGMLDQGEVVTAMLHEARGKGADWVMPLDTDEFWHTGRVLSEILAEDTGSGMIEVPRIEFIQARDQKKTKPRSILRATMRVETPERGVQVIDEYLAGKRSMFETEPQPKVLVRATKDVVVTTGGHTALGIEGPKTVAKEFVIFHFPLRSRNAVMERAARAGEIVPTGGDPYEHVQGRYWSRMNAEGRIAEGWNAHSYENGALDVRGRRVDLIEDGRLVEILEPVIRTMREKLIGRLPGRS